jgi:hypothetical protein
MKNTRNVIHFDTNVVKINFRLQSIDMYQITDDLYLLGPKAVYFLKCVSTFRKNLMHLFSMSEFKLPPKCI